MSKIQRRDLIRDLSFRLSQFDDFVSGRDLVVKKSHNFDILQLATNGWWGVAGCG